MAAKPARPSNASPAQTRREIPIHLSAATVSGLLDGTDTQLRFPVQGKPRFAYACVDARGKLNGDFFISMPTDATRGIVGRCPFGYAGDILLVREEDNPGVGGALSYRTRGPDAALSSVGDPSGPATGLALAVHSTVVSRLKTMTQGDARNHGHVSAPGRSALDSFRALWNGSYPNHAWETNPWVWEITVGRI